MKGFKRWLLAPALGVGYKVLEWALTEDDPIEKYLGITAFLALVSFVIQYYKEKQSGESLSKYARRKLFSLTVELTIEQTLAKRIQVAWIEQYLSSVRIGVSKKFNVTSTFYESDDNFNNDLSKENLKTLSGTFFDDYSSVTKRIFGLKPKLIITGDRGSGKTVMMMNIVEAYATQALSKGAQRNNIPVVLNMSTIPSNSESWEALFRRNKMSYKNEPQFMFEAWIVDQIKINYKIDCQDALLLANGNKLIYFFDGIDDINDEFEIQNVDDGKNREILALHINEIVSLFNSYVKYVEGLFKEIGMSDSALSYVLACRSGTLDSVRMLNSIHELVILEPLSEETIKFVLSRQLELESNDINDEDYYPDSLYNYIFDPSNIIPLNRKKFALDMAKNPYLLTVMRKFVKMRKIGELKFYNRWFSDELKFKFNLLDDYVNEKLDSEGYTNTEYKSQFPDKEKNIRWLTNMSQWTNSSEFILEDLQPFEHVDIRYSRFPSKKLLTYWTLYVLPVILFMLLIIAVPVGISICYEWNFYGSGNSYEKIFNKDLFDKGIFNKEILSTEIFSKSIFEADVYQPGLSMGIKAFLWTSFVLLLTIPLAFIYGSMRLSGYYSEKQKADRKIVKILKKLIPGFVTKSVSNGGFRFALFLAFALAATRFVLIKHSYDSETLKVFETNVALTNFIATFIGCAVLFMLFTASGLLSEDLYVVNRFDHYKIEKSRAIYAIVGGVGVTAILLIPVYSQHFFENRLESENLVIGRSLGFGGVLTICLPLLFSFKPVSDRKIKTKPNHGIRQHLKNSLVSFSILSVAGTLIIYYAYDANVDPPSGIVNAMCGVSFGVLSLMYGFLSVFKHYATRLILALPFGGRSKFPFRATSFLEHMSLTGLVRIVGGRYMFEHSLLAEYFSNKGNSEQGK
ncbi:hypothetical protein MUK70_01590 [Dyadobacter chenwenxiniae]|uniref:NACHT domain-containing protein n=1 Tax=Dyadobacter chenwenxiniae TaxID=2906456 RepID=A0A9X1TE40_9BACT|nr:hypothetical protein [Dyadobacter chenwenxiniae]MCF0062561.1 hypothetical protein [Dyadobacter chenwenxiniae]UON83695.1 hypothetical protein MUK70_01590 [Dyadobacter chenwenxiniae]